MADELHVFSGDISPYELNTIPSNDPGVSKFWNAAYSVIYQANACIEGLEKSKTLKTSVQKGLLSEARTLRAFYYFYLISYFGDVPLISSTDWKIEAKKAREKTDKIYDFISEDLLFGFDNGYTDYSISNGERAKVNKWVAAALLSRVSLYRKKWADAEKYAATVAKNEALFSLEADLDNVFKRNSSEVVFSLAQDVRRAPFNLTNEGRQFVVYNVSQGGIIDYYLDSTLIQEFEPGDKRKEKWLGSIERNGKRWYFPYKYKMGREQQVPREDATEHIVLFRLSELYMILAEASLRLGKVSDGYSYLNRIRQRAELGPKSNSDATQLFNDIVQERRIEFFVEYGHRWLDLIRWDLADKIIPALKPSWKSSAQLLPIPFDEIRRNPSLSQNPGY